MASENQDCRTLVRIFIENHCNEYGLTIYDCSLLKVIAEYCDMSLGFCCLGLSNLERYSRMGRTQRLNTMNRLIEFKLIYRTYTKGKANYRIGELITGKPNDVD